MVKVINLTPHEIIINGKIFPPSGQIARVEEKIEIVRTISVDGTKIPIIKKTFGNVQNLPDPICVCGAPPDQEGHKYNNDHFSDPVIFVVSLLVAQAANRSDVLAIGETIRNEKGQVTGAKSLAVV
ncbi:MAG: hypothetical protein PHP06_05940 [Clostridia bacterium]|nr:hypothetical protein [Clostridia bacterium]